MKKSGKNTGKGSGRSPSRPPSRTSGKSGRPAERSTGRSADRSERADPRKDSRAAGRDTEKRASRPAKPFSPKSGTRDRTEPRSDARPQYKPQGKPLGKPAGKFAARPAAARPEGKYVATARERDDIDARDKRPRGKRAGAAFDRDRQPEAPGRATVKRRDYGDAPRERRERAPSKNLGPRPNLFGMHAVREAWLNPKRSIHALYLTEETEKIYATWPTPRVERPLPIPATKDDLERMLGRDAVHQGFALSAAPLEEVFAQDIISIGAEKPRAVVVMLDQVTDPHNVGAILRSACAFGADGVIMQRRHAPELEGVLCKTACGAVDHLAVAYETNLSRTLEELAEAGYTVIGLDEHAETALDQIDVPEKTVLVLGAEGEGMRRLVKEHCTVLVTLPTRLPIASLNVSNAAAVALYALIK